jgi:hypothetical protein
MWDLLYLWSVTRPVKFRVSAFWFSYIRAAFPGNFWITNQQNKKQTNSLALSPQVNYTDWATAACRRYLMSTFADRWVSRGQRGGSPAVRWINLLSNLRPFIHDYDECRALVGKLSVHTSSPTFRMIIPLQYSWLNCKSNKKTSAKQSGVGEVPDCLLHQNAYLVQSSFLKKRVECSSESYYTCTWLRGELSHVVFYWLCVSHARESKIVKWNPKIWNSIIHIDFQRFSLSKICFHGCDVSGELSASIIRVTRIDELGTTLVLTSNWRRLWRNTSYG